MSTRPIRSRPKLAFFLRLEHIPSDFEDAFDFLEEEPENQAPRRQRRRSAPPDFDDAFAGVERRQVRQATKTGQSIQAGRYEQLTFRLEPEIVDEIKQMAAEEGVSQEAMKRWVVYMGLLAYRNGERPETVEKVVQRQVVRPF